MTAISSVVQLADPALVWLPATGDADLVMIDDDIASDRGLETAVLLSLFTDRRAENDDRPPSGDARDRRGWWGDEFLVPDGDRYGSRLWLLDRSKRTNETVLRAKEYVTEALAWMLEDRVAAGVDVVVETTTSALLIAVTLHRPGRDPVTYRFNHVWEHVQEDNQ
jgi:phage gp46-like protein